MAQRVKNLTLSLLWCHCCGESSIPGLGTSACHRCRQINKLNREKIQIRNISETPGAGLTYNRYLVFPSPKTPVQIITNQ